MVAAGELVPRIRTHYGEFHTLVRNLQNGTALVLPSLPCAENAFFRGFAVVLPSYRLSSLPWHVLWVMPVFVSAILFALISFVWLGIAAALDSVDVPSYSPLLWYHFLVDTKRLIGPYILQDISRFIYSCTDSLCFDPSNRPRKRQTPRPH